MFKKITPEAAGIHSAQVAHFISYLENNNFATHSVLMMRGDEIFAEAYWKPFDKNFCHRMYSQTKSFVGIAIGLLIEDGKLSLDDKIVDLFPDEAGEDQPEEMREMTVRHMLTMSTVGQPEWWFTHEERDRVRLYFRKRVSYRPAGTLWEYDSGGSQVLSTLVEKLSGMSLFDFLNERLFSHMGSFKTAEILKTGSGASWGDSAMICTTQDIASFGRLLMNGGKWKGRQLINEQFVAEATSAVVDNRESALRGIFRHGYGYQIWRAGENGFAFVGMGDQLTICLPDVDLLFAITSDNQGNAAAREMIVSSFFDMIVDGISESPLPEDPKNYTRLIKLTERLELMAIKGIEDSPLREIISGRTYACEENTTGITKFSFVFDGKETGEFRYTNAQGDKIIPFGVNHNVFGKFPQLGYSNGIGGEATADGFTYNDAVSVAWAQNDRLIMKVQIIDKYFGNMSAIFSFKKNKAVCRFEKTAENFLNEYSGSFIATAIPICV